MKRHATQRRQGGFTLMELAVTLSLAGAVIALGAPNFIEFRNNNRLTSAANEFLGAALTARTEALKRQAPVALCPSDNPEDPDAECSDGAFTGWIVFADANNDCLRDDGEDIVRSQPTLEDALMPDSNGVCLSFAANGFRQVIAGRATVTRAVFCDERGDAPTNSTSTDSFARGIDVQPTGRARITRNRTEIVSWAGTGVACP